MTGMRGTYMGVGLFVILAIVGVMIVIVNLSGWTANKDRYVTAFRNVSGIDAGTSVLYEGYPIGQVVAVEPLAADQAQDLGLSAGRLWFRVELDVERNWPIPIDAIANIASSGFLSRPSVSISEPLRSKPTDAAEKTPLLSTGDFIPGEDRVGIFQQAAALAGSLESLVATARATLDERLNPTLDEARGLVHDLRDDAGPIMDNTAEVIVSIERTVEDLRGFVGPEARQQIQQTLVNLEASAADTRRLTGSLNQTARRVDALVARNSGSIDDSVRNLRFVLNALSRDINSINRNLESAARNFNEFSRRIRQNPGLLLRGSRTGLEER